jgi:LDH2 family malate/lactate/ureidoglycolate dehydrogenase
LGSADGESFTPGVRAVGTFRLINGGAILPLGLDRDRGGHKGFCLTAMIDILCDVLSGANLGPFVPPFPHYLKPTKGTVGKGIGHLFGAFRIDGFMEPYEFRRRMDE